MTFNPGDIVQVGKGYQKWTVARTLDSGELMLQSDPSRAEIAGSPSRTKRVDPSKVTLTLLETREQVEQSKAKAEAETRARIRFLRKAKELGVDPHHCSGCWDHVEWATTREEEED